MIVITDLLRFPFDEGAKNSVRNFLACLDPGRNHIIFSINSDVDIGIDVEVCYVNKSFFDVSFLSRLRMLSHDSILYIPESSFTFFSTIRSMLLNKFTGKDVYVFALQPRKFSVSIGLLVKLTAPKMILTPSISYANYLGAEGMDSVSIPLGVNDTVYDQYSENKRTELRCKFNIASNKTVLLHVGHICKWRNIEWLIEIKKNRPDVEVVIVGSTYYEGDSELLAQLESHNIIVISQYIENMADIYNLANYYVFPVVNDQGSIATPLSVLEAMSCNVPIISTKFGSLVDTFCPDDDFYFVDDCDDVLNVLRKTQGKRSKCLNRYKINQYTWKSIARRVEQIVDE